MDAYFGCEEHREYVGGPLWNHHIARTLSYEFRKDEWDLIQHPKSHKCYSKNKMYGLSQIWDKRIKIK